MTDLAELLNAKRSEVMDRWLRRIRREHGSDDLSTAELCDHLPIFFSELLDTLTHQKEPTETESSATASKHGEQRLRHGFDVDQVVREYDLLGDTILEVAVSEGITFSIAEARVLLQLLYAGTAKAVTAYVQRRNEEAQREAGEHVAFMAHELRNPLGNARMALTALRRTALASGGKLVEVLDRNLAQLLELVDQVLTAQQASRIEVRWERLVLQDVLAKAAEELEPEAEDKGVRLALDVEDGLVIEGDRRLLHSVATNLVSNAVKFSRPGGTIMIRGRRREDRAIVEVEDACGGLPDGSPDDLFKPYVQRGEDRSGLGLGLAIVKQAIEAHGGAIEVRNQPGAGCVFIVAVPCVAR